VNSVDSYDSSKWEKWLSDPINRREEKARNVFKDYCWYNLAEGPYKKTFEADGTFKRWSMVLTASGIEVRNAAFVQM
jgi:hypothetical protein